jgi:hypothetical protein
MIREYRGHLIAFIAGQQKGGRWVCQYLIIDSGITGYCDGNFATHSQADAVTIQLAKNIIDSHRSTPSSSPRLSRSMTTGN